MVEVNNNFKQAEVDFEDVHISRDEWPKHTPNTPYGTVPVQVWKLMTSSLLEVAVFNDT